MLRVIRRGLKDNGRFIGILPTFDTVLYLRELWRKYYDRSHLGSEHVKRIITSFDITKKLDINNLSYADDGGTSQCYHTPKSIMADFEKAGLEIVEPLEKVYYPWSLTKRFDYGYFPDAGEEIWDWFVVARRRSSL